jgi:hypothetical protein
MRTLPEKSRNFLWTNPREMQSPCRFLTTDYELRLKGENTAEHIRACSLLNLQRRAVRTSSREHRRGRPLWWSFRWPSQKISSRPAWKENHFHPVSRRPSCKMTASVVLSILALDVSFHDQRDVVSLDSRPHPNDDFWQPDGDNRLLSNSATCSGISEQTVGWRMEQIHSWTENRVGKED